MKRVRIHIILMLILFVMFCGCTVCKKSVDLHKGTIKQNIKICSKPTQAMVYINDRPIGKTPFKTKLEYGSNRLVNIKAVPLFPNQYTQNIFLSVPPIPKKMTIIMTQKPAEPKRKAVSIDIPPVWPAQAPKIQVDTVFVQQTKVEERVIVPPIIYFDSNAVKPYNTDSLDEFITMLKDKMEILVDIYGYSDPREDSQTMSLSRAKAVFNYMVENGIEPSRLHVFGTSGTMQAAMGKEAADPALSRKVMFQLYYDDQK